MNITPPRQHQRGTVLVTTLVIALLVGVAASALVMIAQQQNYLTTRSTSWCSEIPIAEAGIEEAMTHLNSRPTSLNQNGWTNYSGKYYKLRTIGSDSGTNGYYYTTISTATPPTIVSIGYARIPKQTNYTYRTVVALTKLLPPGWGFVAKQKLSMNGNPYVDSYDSSTDTFSTNKKYDPAKRRDRVGVASVSSLKPAVDTGNGKIYGSVATGVGGTVSGNVGDGNWLASNGGQQSGHVSDDFNMAIPDVALPSPWNPQLTLPLPGVINGVAYTAVLTAGDWQFNGGMNPSGAGVYVQGKVRVFINGDFKMTSTTAVTLAPGATIEMYMGGSMDLAGNCVINPGGVPSDCVIYGLPACTSMKYAGTAAAYCRLYAPQADITITGNFDFSGSAVGNTVSFQGTADVHYDEALRGGPDYQIVSWEEQ